MKAPWIRTVLGMIDCPSIDYDTKKKDSPKTAQDQQAALKNFFS